MNNKYLCLWQCINIASPSRVCEKSTSVLKPLHMIDPFKDRPSQSRKKILTPIENCLPGKEQTITPWICFIFHCRYFICCFATPQPLIAESILEIISDCTWYWGIVTTCAYCLSGCACFTKLEAKLQGETEELNRCGIYLQISEEGFRMEIFSLCVWRMINASGFVKWTYG